MNAQEWNTGLYALATAMAECLDTAELSRVGVLFTQLGTALETLAALRELDEAEAAESVVPPNTG